MKVSDFAEGPPPTGRHALDCTLLPLPRALHFNGPTGPEGAPSTVVGLQFPTREDVEEKDRRQPRVGGLRGLSA